MVVAFIGADGSGKSTVAYRTLTAPPPVFRRTEYFHFRPALGLKRLESGPVIDPHGRRPWNKPLSVAKILYLLFTFQMGWWIAVWPLLIRSTLVVFDRYYHDLLVDPLRYRYGGPMWLARWVGKLIPNPDLWILLDAPPEVLQDRKQEVPTAETIRQRRAYLDLVHEMDNAIVVDASQPLDKVVADVNSAILTVMAERARKRLGRTSDR